MITPHDKLLDKLSTSNEYGEYIMNNCHGERVIGNGDALIEAMEEQYLWEEFLDSIGVCYEDSE